MHSPFLGGRPPQGRRTPELSRSIPPICENCASFFCQDVKIVCTCKSTPAWLQGCQISLFFCCFVSFAGGSFRQHRTIPALRLKHRSGSCGTASALPKMPIRHPVLSALLAWHRRTARRIGTQNYAVLPTFSASALLPQWRPQCAWQHHPPPAKHGGNAFGNQGYNVGIHAKTGAGTLTLLATIISMFFHAFGSRISIDLFPSKSRRQTTAPACARRPSPECHPCVPAQLKVHHRAF